MKKVLSTLLLLLSLNTMAIDIITLPSQILFTGKAFIYSRTFFEAPVRPLTIIFMPLTFPLALLDEETNMAQIPVEKLLEQRYKPEDVEIMLGNLDRMKAGEALLPEELGAIMTDIYGVDTLDTQD